MSHELRSLWKNLWARIFIYNCYYIFIYNLFTGKVEEEEPTTSVEMRKVQFDDHVSTVEYTVSKTKKRRQQDDNGEFTEDLEKGNTQVNHLHFVSNRLKKSIITRIILCTLITLYKYQCAMRTIDTILIR